MSYELHKLAKKYPTMEKREFEALIKSIKENGLLNPITLFRGEIVDGRHRYKACKKAGVKPRFVEFKGEEKDLEEFVDAKNAVNRHLNKSQLACLAALQSSAVESVDMVKLELVDLVISDNLLGDSKLLDKFGISKTHLKRAKKLLKEDLVKFMAVFSGESSLKDSEDKGDKKPKKEYNVKKAVKKQKSLGVIEETDEGYDFSRWLNEAGQKKRDWVKKWKKATRKLFKEIREDETAFQGSDGELCESLLTS